MPAADPDAQSHQHAIAYTDSARDGYSDLHANPGNRCGRPDGDDHQYGDAYANTRRPDRHAYDTGHTDCDAGHANLDVYTHHTHRDTRHTDPHSDACAVLWRWEV